jgi:hypothetical protein
MLLVYNTTACPSWCSGAHDVSGPKAPFADSRRYIIHPGPQLCFEAYNGSPNPTATGWGAQLVAYEYVDNPGRLHVLVDLAGESDGLHDSSGGGWAFELPPGTAPQAWRNRRPSRRTARRCSLT